MISTPIAAVPFEPAPPVAPALVLEPTPARPIPSSGRTVETDFSTWLRQHAWSIPRPVMHGSELHYETEGASGRFSVVIGQKRAEWNGWQLLLGFEPRVVAGRVWLHPLDVQDHVEPLLGGTLWQPSNHTIVLDPGHGGRSPGSRSIAGNQFEKDFTLDWALRLRRLLEARGWTVWLTRTNDLEMSLTERVDFAEATGAAVFVSLHFNSSFPNLQAAGLETYSLTPQGMASHVVREYPDEVGRAFPNNAHDADNLRIAARIHQAIVEATGETDRGIRHARFMDVLRWQNRPAILIEGGYLSNPAEARQIQSPAFRQRLADGVAAGLP